MSRSATEKTQHQSVQAVERRVLSSHTALMQDMREFQQRVTRTPDAALGFLKRAGLVTASGKPKQLIRG
ncbi:MAG: hypothetical protein RLZZ352_723 [Pseudomonadota bacterium]|jgi:SpoVK/Ycf46/Vps4 family AAA+-type ATPase